MATTKVPNNLIDLSGDSGAVPWAAGTTAQRPVSPNAGDFRYNTDDTKFEFYNGTLWRQITSFNPYQINYLMLAGGGGGASTNGDAGGGGGAGGALTSYTSNRDADISPLSSLTFSSGTTYTITIGAGGASGSANTDQNGSQGDNSILSGSGITTLTAVGGGYGSTRYIGINGGNGGCGGGAGGGDANKTGGDGTAGQGFDGADKTTSNNIGCGGGGTQEAGGGEALPTGGDGLESSITGTAAYYGGGGGGGQGAGTGTGGNGGGGNGGAINVSGGNATANTGGGGGGQGRRYQTGAYSIGANGASGVIILRMLTAIYSGTTTGSPTVTTVGTDTILTYTGSGTYTH
jgi:hypothetical protein